VHWPPTQAAVNSDGGHEQMVLPPLDESIAFSCSLSREAAATLAAAFPSHPAQSFAHTCPTYTTAQSKSDAHAVSPGSSCVWMHDELDRLLLLLSEELLGSLVLDRLLLDEEVRVEVLLSVLPALPTVSPPQATGSIAMTTTA